MYNESTLEKWITWNWFDDYKGMDEVSEEHVWAMMKEGYTSGELNRLNDKGEEIRGWWERIKK